MNSNFNILDRIQTAPAITYKIFERYLLNIDKYKNISFTALPVRIITPDRENSIFDNITDATYKKNISDKTGLKYKVYEFVPAFYTSPITYALMNDPSAGLKFDATVNISLIGFDDITIGSYVQFYGDYLSKIVFEVSNIRTPLTTNIIVPIFELDLIRAPSDIDLDISQVYFYDYSEEKFLPKEKFEEKIEKLNYLVNTLIPDINKNCFDSDKEVFNDLEEFNLYLCTTIADRFNKNYRRIDINIPFGYCFKIDAESLSEYPKAKDILEKIDLNSATDCQKKYYEFLKIISEVYNDEY
jgi:hypothetical protein